MPTTRVDLLRRRRALPVGTRRLAQAQDATGAPLSAVRPPERHEPFTFREHASTRPMQTDENVRTTIRALQSDAPISSAPRALFQSAPLPPTNSSSSSSSSSVSSLSSNFESSFAISQAPPSTSASRPLGPSAVHQAVSSASSSSASSSSSSSMSSMQLQQQRQRPSSARSHLNKKFLDKYNLSDRLDLFAPKDQ